MLLVKQWYFGEINSNIEPLNGIPTPMYKGGIYFPPFYNDTPLYNSAVFQTPSVNNKRTYGGIWFFDTEPTITTVNGGGGVHFDPQKVTDGTYWFVSFYVATGDNSILNGYSVPFYDNANDFVDYVSTPTIVYNWQSVPSISGKNGILQSLSTLVNINDGNPVSGASASAVNIIPASVVSGMIQTGASDVIVSFEIPQLTSGTYDSIKLVGKRGGIPRSKTDGEFIETLSDSDTSKTLTGLTKGYTYWFVIFAEDSKGSSSESDPYPYETGEGESVAFFEIDLGQGGKDIVRYDASKSIGSHKQGELYGNYSIANDELSTNGYIYWDYDATENPKSIPADCCLYFEYDTLFTGQEGYLDWYVLDSNNDQQIYWCYDTKYAFQSDKWYNCLVVAEVKNGYIKRYKYVLDGIEIAHDTANIKMPCTDAEGSIGISEIYFRTTRPTKIKNMSIYYDFSTYTDAGGGGGGGSGASGSNPVS